MVEAETVVTATSLKISVPREELTRQLGVVVRAASTRTTVQVLAGLLLRAGDGRLELAATDMEISLRSSLEATVESEGAVVVPSKLLADLVRLLPADDVSIEHRSGEGIVEIVSGAATYRLHTYNAEDFPRLPDASSVELMTVNADAVLETAGQRVGGVTEWGGRRVHDTQPKILEKATDGPAERVIAGRLRHVSQPDRRWTSVPR